MPSRPVLLVVVTLVLACIVAPCAGQADEMRTYAIHGTAYDDVKMDLEQAIEHKGLTIGTTGNLGDMLERTRAAVGAGPAVYKSAHFLQFCSAVLAHKLAAADPRNIGHCPFVMFIYQTAANPGEIVIGYRRIDRTGSAATMAALAEVEAVYEAIAAEVVR